MGKFAALFGQNFTETCIVPHLIHASNDNNMRVRKACAEIFPEISAQCSEEIKREILTPQFLGLLHDPQRLVHISCATQLGLFIASFADPTKTGVVIRNGRVKHLEKSTT